MTRKLLSLMLALLLALGLTAALAEDFDGFYDFDAPYGLDTDINLILTPDGHGRLINSTSSVNFDFAVEGDRLVPESDQLTLELNGNGRVTASVTGIAIDFIKRADVAGGEDIVGTWSITGMESGGITYSADMLTLAGLKLDVTFYPSGAVSWHAVTDSDSTLAQGWGADDEGFYVNNGDVIVRAELEGDTLTLIHPGNGRGEVKYRFARAD